MIPISLTLKNFMSYGEEATTLSFEGLHVACLSGDNGNGKSALLDAITWALWGKTRASGVQSVSDDDLIRVGTTDMEVRFTFELSGQQYRVVRKRKRGKTSASDWQLTQVGEDGKFIPIGGGSQRETGKIITQLLSMEHETFLNSAYLQQGRADEFTRQTPINRKRILSEILGLDRYDRLEAKAKERARTQKEAADELAGQMRLLESEIAQLDDHRARLEESRSQLSEAEKRVETQEKATAKLRDRKSRLDAQANIAHEAEQRLLRLDAEIAQREKERCAKIVRLEELKKIRDQREAILRDYSDLQTARRRRELLDPEIKAFNDTTAERNTVLGTIDIEKSRLEGDLRLQESELRGLEQQARELTDLEARLRELDTALRGEAEAEKTLTAVTAQRDTLQQTFSELSARNKALEQEIKDIEDVLAILQSPRAACPVCESDLSGKKQETVIARQRQKEETLRREKETVKQEGVATKKALTTVQETAQQAEGRVREFAAMRSRQQEWSARRETLQAATQQLPALQKQVQTLRKQLETGEFAQAKRLILQRLEKELLRLGLAKQEYEVVLQRIRALEPTEQRHQQLQSAEENWEREAEEARRLEQTVAEKRKEYATEQVRLEAQRAELGEYETITRQATIAENDLARLREEAQRHRTDVGRYTDYIAHGERSAEELKRKKKEFDRTDEERKMYQALASAFGKKGVQALIIENVLPELEEETNELLARMTDNAMQVRFQTTRAARTGSSEIETLDIQVMDDAGPRAYELFSGGEGFRINFAIRIALSRLLARRSGARLQTLILDEGFGSQDGKGREKLLEVIEAIKEDFDKILVITHFEEMKDAFAQRIEIVKGADGSRIHLL